MFVRTPFYADQPHIEAGANRAAALLSRAENIERALSVRPRVPARSEPVHGQANQKSIQRGSALQTCTARTTASTWIGYTRSIVLSSRTSGHHGEAQVQANTREDGT